MIIKYIKIILLQSQKIQPNRMGNQTKNRQNRAETQMAQSHNINSQAYVNNEQLKIYFCCGAQFLRSKSKEIWRIRFEQNMQELKEYYKWTSKLLNLYKQNSNISRTEYLKEIHELKYGYTNQSKSSQKKINEQEMINLDQIIQNTVLFKKELIKSMAIRSKPVEKKPINQKKSTFIDKINQKKTFINKRSILVIQEKSHINKKKVLPNVSFVDQSIRTLFSPINKQQQLDSEATHQLKLFIKFTQVIEKHCQNQDNFLCKLKESFIEYLITTYRIQSPCETQLTNDVNQFIQLYKQTILDFYKIEILEQLFNNKNLFNEQNMVNAATSILFKDQRVYNIIFQTYASLNKKEQNQIQQIFENKNNIFPEDFQINPEYCLNKKTVENYIEKLSMDNQMENMSIPVVIDFTPYENCIKKLKLIQQTKTPIGKLKIIVSCAEKISPSITHFYESNNLDIKSTIIDADQILSIFSFITINSQIKNLGTHLKIIQNFASKNELKSMTGYYYNVVLSAVENLKINRRQT